MNNGWAKIDLEKLLEPNTHVLDIHAGTPIRPSILDEADIRANRKGFFAGLSRAFGSKIQSQLTLTSRPFHKLMAIKQVFSFI